MFKTITKSWKQASDLFSKKEILLFIFSWIRTFKRSFGIFLKYFWWLIAAEIICKTNLFSVGHYHTFLMALAGLLSMLSMFFSILTVRASLGVKDVTYFMAKSKKLAEFSLLYIPLVTLLSIFIIWNTGVSPFHWTLSTRLGGTNLILQVITALFLLFSGLIMIDNRSTINRLRVIKNTCQSIFMYLPVLLVLSILYIAFYYGVGFCMSLIHPSLAITSILFLNFFFTCAIAVLYLKIRHRNHAMFFGNS